MQETVILETSILDFIVRFCDLAKFDVASKMGHPEKNFFFI